MTVKNEPKEAKKAEPAAATTEDLVSHFTSSFYLIYLCP